MASRLPSGRHTAVAASPPGYWLHPLARVGLAHVRPAQVKPAGRAINGPARHQVLADRPAAWQFPDVELGLRIHYLGLLRINNVAALHRVQPCIVVGYPK